MPTRISFDFYKYVQQVMKKLIKLHENVGLYNYAADIQLQENYKAFHFPLSQYIIRLVSFQKFG